MKKSKFTVLSLIALSVAGLAACGNPITSNVNEHAIFWCTMGQDKRQALDACAEAFNQEYEGKYHI